MCKRILSFLFRPYSHHGGKRRRRIHTYATMHVQRRRHFRAADDRDWLHCFRWAGVCTAIPLIVNKPADDPHPSPRFSSQPSRFHSQTPNMVEWYWTDHFFPPIHASSPCCLSMQILLPPSLCRMIETTF